MRFNAFRPVIRTNELEATIEFYSTLLGFTCIEKNDDWGWASLQRDQTEIMLAKPNEHMPFEKPTLTGSFYFNISDVNAFWAELKNKAKIV